MQGRRIVLGVGGSVAAYKAAHLTRELLRRGAEVRVVLTSSAQRFVGVPLFAALTGQPVATDLFAVGAPDHIALAAWAEAAVVAPATADLLAKAAAGIADDYLTTWLLAFPGPVLWAPTMNRHMWSHPVVQRNLSILRADGAHLLSPGYGALGARGEGEGWGRLPEPPEVADRLEALCGSAPPSRRAQLPSPRTDFAGLRVLVTAGPTREPLDPTRYLSNPSTGKMGYAVAEAARDRGAEVVLISGPVGLEPPHGMRRVSVTTAVDMRDAVMAEAADADLLVAAAAVADFRPTQFSPTKLKKADTGAEVELRLVPNPDILTEVAALGLCRVRIGFAAEAGAGPEEALRKLVAKGLDLIAYNDVRAPGAGFAQDTNRVLLVDREGGQEDTGLVSKREVAERILDRARMLLDRR